MTMSELVHLKKCLSRRTSLAIYIGEVHIPFIRC
jgi:hypothetical protein